MKTKIHSQSGIFNPRILVAFALGSVGVLLAMLSFAAAPALSMPLAPSGLAWSIVTSPNTSATHENVLSGVTCTSASDCWAVGQYNTDFSSPHTLVEHWNGAAWSIVLTNITQENVPFGVTCTSASDCWAVGYWGTTDNIFHTFAAHWNGAAWSFVTSPNTSTTQPNRLDGVTCSSASDCWAVGGYWDDANVSHTLSERYTPTPTLTNASTRLKVLTGDNVFIGGLIIGGSDSMTVLYRALGPTLSAFNVPGVLADPTLELHTTDNMGHDVIVATN